MNRRIVALAFVLPTSALLFQSQAAPARPNVIIVMPDDQGYGDLECHGNPVLKTPHLNRLHSESVRFTDFHVAPMCTPTRGQLLSGQDAFRNGAMNVSSGRTLLRANVHTLPQILKSNGYATGMFGKWHLGDNYPFRPQDRGFEESLWFASSHINSVADFWNNDYFDDTYIRNGRRQKYKSYTTDVFFTEAMDWMKPKKDKPFFCYIPTAAAHWPHFVPQSFRDATTARLKAALPSLPKINPGKQATLASFLAMIENIDHNMGRLENFLKDSGLRDNTILIFLTDNGSTMGPSYYNAGMKGKKVTLWEGGHRVPLFIRGPKGNLGKPRDISDLSHVQDLLPTLLDLTDSHGIPANLQHDGFNLTRRLKGEMNSLPERMLVVNYSRMLFRAKLPTPINGATPRKEGAAVLWKRWRLLENNALYNLDQDPMQNRNVIEQHPEIAAKMRERLDGWWNEVKGRVNEPSRVIIGSPKENPSMLTACEWWDVFIDQQIQVRRADLKNGVWHLDVAEAGNYTIELSRYPKEANLSIGQGIPPTKVTDGEFMAGKPLPIRGARLKIGDQEKSIPLARDAKSAVFKFRLPKGKTEMQSWFQDAEGKSMLGAIFTENRSPPFLPLSDPFNGALKRPT